MWGGRLWEWGLQQVCLIYCYFLSTLISSWWWKTAASLAVRHWGPHLPSSQVQCQSSSIFFFTVSFLSRATDPLSDNSILLLGLEKTFAAIPGHSVLKTGWWWWGALEESCIGLSFCLNVPASILLCWEHALLCGTPCEVVGNSLLSDSWTYLGDSITTQPKILFWEWPGGRASVLGTITNNFLSGFYLSILKVFPSTQKGLWSLCVVRKLTSHLCSF